MAALQGVANRDVKLENTLLVSSARPLIKLCDFGYSKVRIKAMHLLLSSEGSPQVLFSEDLLFLFFRTKSSSRLQAPKWERQHIWPQRSSQPPGAGPMMARQVSPSAISFGDLFAVSLCTCEAICGWEGDSCVTTILLRECRMTSAAAGCGCVVVWRDALRHALCAVPIWASRGHKPETSSPNAQHAAGEQHLPSSCIHHFTSEFPTSCCHTELWMDGAAVPLWHAWNINTLVKGSLP